MPIELMRFNWHLLVHSIDNCKKNEISHRGRETEINVTESKNNVKIFVLIFCFKLIIFILFNIIYKQNIH